MSTTGQPLNFNAADPAAPSGAVNVVFQADTPTALPTAVVRNVSASMPPATATTGGAVPTPPNDQTKLLCGDMAYRKLTAGSNVTITETSTAITVAASGGGGGGGSNDDISFYLSPTTITPPSGLTWAYHTNAAFGTNANGAGVIATYSSADLEVIGETISNTEDFDLVACLICNPGLSGTIAFGLVLWDSASGKLVRFIIEAGESANIAISVQYFATFTSGSGTTAVSLSNAYWGFGVPVWLRINLSYGKFTFYISVDGQSWDLFYQLSSTAYLSVPPTNAGIGYYNGGASLSHLVIPHFVVNSYVGS